MRRALENFFFWASGLLFIRWLHSMKLRFNHLMFLPLCLGGTSFFLLINYGRGADPFGEGVRSTDPLTPEQEQKSFHLPGGFEIQLFAAEPDIAKPLNLAFDANGRLWVTVTREYPYPAPADKAGRDAIKILEDTDGDGRADKITAFADGLNIPIGIHPYQEGAIAWSIPNIWHFRDTDGDGKSDQRQVLFGPLGEPRDTHGMQNAFRRGFDGWLYINHGFNNDSTIRGRDGSQIKLNSGNTYRVRPDGSRVEQFTWGQVNPFGMCLDALGNIYTADCHSAPIYQVVRGGYYPSFGKPHDGLGFGPVLMEHSHGSTAISGIVYCDGDHWPAEYRDNILVGNVMTSRLNRDKLTFNGSTPTAKEMPDFLRTDDPWFRPADLQLGPDGALYIADFYNRIIGHYEVPLAHPGRDRERGRIWRVVYRGPRESETLSNPEQSKLRGGSQKKSRRERTLALPHKRVRRDLAEASTGELIAALAEANLAVRMLAMNQLVDRIGPAASAPVKKLLRDKKSTAFQKIHGLWILHQLGELEPRILVTAAKDADRAVRTHAMKVLSETESWTPAYRQAALAGLQDADPFVQRAAADALGQHPAFEHVQPLLARRQRVPAADSHLLYGVRLALRNQLVSAGNLTRSQASGLSETDARALADVAVAVSTPEAGTFLLKHIQQYNEDKETLSRYLRHAARYVAEGQMDELAALIRQKFSKDLDLQLTLFKSVQEGTAQRGATLSAGARAWGAKLAEHLLASVDQSSILWVNTPIAGMKKAANPWFLQQRSSADGDKTSTFLCSLPPGGEQLTGILRSKPFSVPAQINFFMAGHDGFPDKPAQKRNVIRLRATNTHEILAESFPPRNDTAQPFSWDLTQHTGQSGYLEIVDGDNGGAFAWLAVGRFNPVVVALPVMNPSQVAQRQQDAADLARTLLLRNLEPQLNHLLSVETTDWEARAAAARALVALSPTENTKALIPLLGDPEIPLELRGEISRTFVNRKGADARFFLTDALRTAPYRVQTKLAQALASNGAGAETLLQMIERGQASPRLLLAASVKDKLFAAKPENVAQRLDKITKNLAPISEEIEKLLERRRNAYAPTKPLPVEGARVFVQSCAVCHRIDGQGGLVGPQLDGIGNRGLERLIEDVLDPNRNVDQAFRNHLLTLKNGEIISGLPRREEGEVLVLADSTGKEISIPKNDIQERRESDHSLMPENFGEILVPEDFNHLMAFLLSKGSKGP